MADNIDPTGLVGPTQAPGEPSILDLGAGFARGGLYGAAKAGGAQTPPWMDKAASALQNPDLNTAMGMAAPVTPPNFAANLKMLAERTELSGNEIARILGVGEATIKRHLAKLGLSRPTSVETGAWSDPKNVETLKKMHAEGADDWAIGKALGLAPNVIQPKRQRLGLWRNNEPGGRTNQATTRRWGGTAEGFAIPVSGAKPTLPKTAVPDPQEPGHPWLMRQQGYQFDTRPVEHDPFEPAPSVAETLEHAPDQGLKK